MNIYINLIKKLLILFIEDVILLLFYWKGVLLFLIYGSIVMLWIMDEVVMLLCIVYFLIKEIEVFCNNEWVGIELCYGEYLLIVIMVDGFGNKV